MNSALCDRPRSSMAGMVTIVALIALVIPSAVMAKNVVKCQGNGKGWVQVKYQFPPLPVVTEESGKQNIPFCYNGVRFNGLDHVVFSACCTPTGLVSYFLTFGNATGEVTPGVHPESHDSTPIDSITVLIAQGINTVTLTFAPDATLRAGKGLERSEAQFQLAVYDDSTTAEGDAAFDGTGAAFFGSVTLLASGALSTSGGFSNSDFDVVDAGDGTFTATPVIGLTRIVNVPLGVEAVVGLATNSNSYDVLPGLTTVGLVVLLLLLAGAAYRGLRTRPATVS